MATNRDANPIPPRRRLVSDAAKGGSFWETRLEVGATLEDFGSEAELVLLDLAVELYNLRIAQRFLPPDDSGEWATEIRLREALRANRSSDVVEVARTLPAHSLTHELLQAHVVAIHDGLGDRELAALLDRIGGSSEVRLRDLAWFLLTCRNAEFAPRVLERFPPRPDVYEARYIFASAVEDEETTGAILKEGLEAFPNSLQLRTCWVDREIRAGRAESAFREAAEILRASPSDLHVYCVYANACRQSGRRGATFAHLFKIKKHTHEFLQDLKRAKSLRAAL
jgi:hypothetical protein